MRKIRDLIDPPAFLDGSLWGDFLNMIYSIVIFKVIVDDGRREWGVLPF